MSETAVDRLLDPREVLVSSSNLRSSTSMLTSLTTSPVIASTRAMTFSRTSLASVGDRVAISHDDHDINRGLTLADLDVHPLGEWLVAEPDTAQQAPEGRAHRIHSRNLEASRKRGFGSVGVGWVHHVTRSARAAKLWGLVKPWAVRRRTWRRLLVPSMRPLLGSPGGVPGEDAGACAASSVLTIL